MSIFTPSVIATLPTICLLRHGMSPLELSTPSGYYMYQPPLAASGLAFCIYGFCMILTVNSVNQLIFVMVKCGVLFEVRTEFLNNI
jgi:hypothetical protein